MKMPNISAKKLKSRLDYGRSTIIALFTVTNKSLFGADELIGKVRFKRALAFVIDLGLLYTIAIYFNFPEWITVGVYFILLEGILGVGSIGKLITRIKVDVEDANNNGELEFKIFRIFARSIPKAYFSAMLLENLHWGDFPVFPLVYFYLLFRMSAVGRSTHDLLTGTIVNLRDNTQQIQVDDPNRIYKYLEDTISRFRSNKSVSDEEGSMVGKDKSTLKKDEIEELY